MSKVYEFTEFVYRVVTLFYLIPLPLAIVWFVLKITVAIHGLAYIAYPCIDTFPNSVCDVVLNTLR